MIKQFHFNTILHFTFTLNGQAIDLIIIKSMGQAASECLQP